MLCFSLITALIAVANVFNTLANGIILRTREFAVLRRQGMGNRAFARMLAYECASYAARGLVIGLAAATAVTWALHRATSLAFAGLAFSLPWGYVGAAVGIVLAVLALSVAYALAAPAPAASWRPCAPTRSKRAGSSPRPARAGRGAPSLSGSLCGRCF